MKVYIIAAMSADGFITDDISDQREWTSREDKAFFKDKTVKSTVVIMGNSTYKAIGEPLVNRLNIVYSSDSTLRDMYGLEYTQLNPGELIRDLAKRGFIEIAIIGGQQIYTMFMNSGLVTDLYITVEPVLLGSGKTLFKNLISQHDINLHRSNQLNPNTILNHYKIQK